MPPSAVRVVFLCLCAFLCTTGGKQQNPAKRNPSLLFNTQQCSMTDRKLPQNHGISAGWVSTTRCNLHRGGGTEKMQEKQNCTQFQRLRPTDAHLEAWDGDVHHRRPPPLQELHRFSGLGHNLGVDARRPCREARLRDASISFVKPFWKSMTFVPANQMATQERGAKTQKTSTFGPKW